MSLVSLGARGQRGARFVVGGDSRRYATCWFLGRDRCNVAYRSDDDGVYRRRLKLGIESEDVDLRQLFVDVAPTGFGDEVRIRARLADGAEKPVRYYDASRREVRELRRATVYDLGDGDILLFGRTTWDYAFKVYLHWDAGGMTFDWWDLNSKIRRAFRMTVYDSNSLRMRTARDELTVPVLRHAVARLLGVSVFELRGFELTFDPPGGLHNLYDRHLAHWRGYIPVFLITTQLEERPRVQEHRANPGVLIFPAVE